MALLTPVVVKNLESNNFIDEFNAHEDNYLGLAVLIAQAVYKYASTVNDSIDPDEEFAEKLVPFIADAFLGNSFPLFRQALARRLYISAIERPLWSYSMARYVLFEAIRQRRI